MKWIEDRRENLMRSTMPATPTAIWKSPATRDGTILALRGHAFADIGAYMRTNGATGVAQYFADHVRAISHSACAHGCDACRYQ